MARDISSDDVLKQQKARAMRVDHSYYNRPHPWRTVMRIASWGAPLVVGVVIAVLQFLPPGLMKSVATGSGLYSPGPVSTKHAIFANNCDKCHDSTGTMFGAVTDAKCLACHDGPLHNSRQVHQAHNTATGFIETRIEKDGVVGIEKKQVQAPSPRCATCHTEHRGNQHLADIQDSHCTQCHLDLKVSEGTPKYQSGIAHFNKGHPEWAALRPGAKDPTQLKFNHFAHLGPTSPVKTGNGEKLVCASCHVPDAQRAYMKPISYEAHCQDCHAIGIPPVPGIGPVPLPHGKPANVKGVLTVALLEFLKSGKTPTIKAPNPAFPKLRPGQPKPKNIPEFIETPDPRTPDQWLKETTDAALEPLFFPKEPDNKSCVYCHSVKEKKDEVKNLPVIELPNIPSIWLKSSRFDHEAHRVVTCNDCHGMAAGSKETSDVLLPNIANCQQCHHPTGARSGCNECHIFHDKKHANYNGKITVQDLLK